MGGSQRLGVGVGDGNVTTSLVAWRDTRRLVEPGVMARPRPHIILHYGQSPDYTTAVPHTCVFTH